jgi:hypothetical protein
VGCFSLLLSFAEAKESKLRAAQKIFWLKPME